MPQETLHKVALSFIKGFGSTGLKRIISYTGGIEAFFTEKKHRLLKISGVGTVALEKLNRSEALSLAEEELRFMEANQIKYTSYLDADYPHHLLNCIDSPCVLYYKGNASLNPIRNISIIGTRNATSYGLEQCNQLIDDLAQLKIQPTITSGLAYGIDICAHKAALRNGLPTIAALGHGFHLIYPSQHRQYAEQIVENGLLITEFTSNSRFDPKNFVRRNRIIAGISDATVVIESASKGGSLVTADIANSYNKDVFAYPGKVNDKYSSGCNNLIKTNKACLMESAKDLELILDWDEASLKSAPKEIQTRLFVELSPEEQLIADVLKTNGKTSIDVICGKTKLTMSKVSVLLLQMEFNGVVKSFPGKIYALIQSN